MNAPCLKIGSLPIPSLPSRCLRSSRGLSAASSPINILKQIPALPPHPAMNVCTEYTQGFLFPALSETGWAVEPRGVANSSSCLRFQSPGIAALCRHGELAQVYVNEPWLAAIVTPGAASPLGSRNAITISLLFKNYFHLYVFVFACMDVCVPHVCPVAPEAGRAHRRTGIADRCEPPRGCWEQNLGPARAASALNR